MYLKIPFQTEQNIDLSTDLTQLELLIIKMLCKKMDTQTPKNS